MTSGFRTLTLREYESAAIGPAWDAARKIVPSSVADEVERLQVEQGIDCFEVTRRRMTARNFVGVIGVREHSIEILPKTDNETDPATRHRLIEMLAVAGIVPHLEAGIANLALSATCLLDVFMQAYIRQLALEWQRGRIARYRRTDENRDCLRGKLLFSEQLRRNALNPARFFTRADEFLVDALPSRLLKAALEVCRLHATLDTTRRNAMTLLAEFDEVSSCTLTSAEWDRVQVDRQISRFEPLLVMAKSFLRGCAGDRPGGLPTFSLLFDMNAVFEQYIGNLLRRVCPQSCTTHLQLCRRSLLRRNGRDQFRLRPDVTIRNRHDNLVLVDTKWKRLDPNKPYDGVRQADMYQAYAYAREHKCPRVILLYPRIGGLKGHIVEYGLQTDTGPPSQIEIKTVDVSRSETEVAEELRAMIETAIQPPVGS